MRYKVAKPSMSYLDSAKTARDLEFALLLRGRLWLSPTTFGLYLVHLLFWSLH